MTGREPPQGPAGGQRWVVLGTWFLASVSGFMVLSTLGILLPSVSEELGLSPSQQGLLGSAAYWGNLVLAIPHGVAWGFFPILYSVPFQLRGIRPREIAVAIAFLTVMTSLGFLLGPLATGFLQEAIDLRTALRIVSLSAVSLTVTGMILRPVSTSEVTKDSEGVAVQSEH